MADTDQTALAQHVSMPSRSIFLAAALITVVTVVSSGYFLFLSKETSAANLGSFIGGVSQFIAFLWLVVACYYQLALLRIQVADFRHQLHEFTQQRKATEITSLAQEIASLMTIHDQFRHSLTQNLRYIIKRLDIPIDLDIDTMSDAHIMSAVLHEAAVSDALIKVMQTNTDPLTSTYMAHFVKQYSTLLSSARLLGYKNLPASQLLELSDTYMVYNSFKEILDLETRVTITS